MIKQLIINGKKSYDDFDLYISERTISQPKKKSIKESVPFSNVVYDFSDINGEIYWEERTLKYVFDFAELSTEEVEVAKSKALTWLMNVHDTDIYDPYIGDYHFHGSFESDSWSEDFGAGTLTINFSVYPYKISNSDTSIIEEIGDELTGSSPLIINNSASDDLESLTIYGASEQETTNGYQLVDFSSGTISTGITKSFENDVLIVTGDGSLPYQNWSKDITGVITENPSKVLHCDFENLELTDTHDGSIVQLNIAYNDDTKSYIQLCSVSGIKKPYTIPSDVSNIKSVHIAVYSSNASTSKANTIRITKPMLQFGTDKLEYEKYTGRVPSPNPNYPSEIKTIKGVSNFLPYPYVDTTKTINGITFTDVGDGSIIVNGTATANASFKLYGVSNKQVPLENKYITCGVASNSLSIRVVNNTNNTYNVVTSTNINNLFAKVDNTTYKEGYYELVVYSGHTINNIVVKPMIIDDINKTDYVPYGTWLRVDTKSPNLYNFKDKREQTSGVTIDEDGWITCTYDNSIGSKSKYLNYYTNNLDLKTNTDYIVVVEIKEVTGQGNLYPFSNHSNGGQFTSSANLDFTKLSNGLIRICKGKTRTSFSDIIYGIRSFIEFPSGKSGSITFRISVLEDITITADKFKYSSYGEDYALIDMAIYDEGGNIIGYRELCEIGDTKDEMFLDKSTNKITQRIGKFILDGSENWNISNSGTDNWYYICNISSKIITANLHNANVELDRKAIALSNLYLNSDVGNANTNKGMALFSNGTTTTNIRIREEVEGTIEEFKTRLSEQNLIGYGILATPVEINNEPIILPKTFDDGTIITINDELEVEIDVTYNEKKTLIIDNVSSHRVTPTIMVEGDLTIELNNTSYGLSTGTYNNGLYLESGINEVILRGTGKIKFSYVEEVL